MNHKASKGHVSNNSSSSSSSSSSNGQPTGQKPQSHNRKNNTGGSTAPGRKFTGLNQDELKGLMVDWSNAQQYDKLFEGLKVMEEPLDENYHFLLEQPKKEEYTNKIKDDNDNGIEVIDAIKQQMLSNLCAEKAKRSTTKYDHFLEDVKILFSTIEGQLAPNTIEMKHTTIQLLTILVREKCYRDGSTMTHPMLDADINKDAATYVDETKACLNVLKLTKLHLVATYKMFKKLETDAPRKVILDKMEELLSATPTALELMYQYKASKPSNPRNNATNQTGGYHNNSGNNTRGKNPGGKDKESNTTDGTSLTSKGVEMDTADAHQMLMAGIEEGHFDDEFCFIQTTTYISTPKSHSPPSSTHPDPDPDEPFDCNDGSFDEGIQSVENRSADSVIAPISDATTHIANSEIEHLFSQSNGSIDPNWILLNINIHCNASCVMMRHVGDLPGFGMVWYQEGEMTNVLSLCLVSGGQFDQTPCGLYYVCNILETSKTILAITTVKRQKQFCLDLDKRRVTKARKLQETLGFPHTAEFLCMIGNNLILSCPATVQCQPKHLRKDVDPVPARILSRCKQVTLGIDMYTSVIGIYSDRGFVVRQVFGNNEFNYLSDDLLTCNPPVEFTGMAWGQHKLFIKRDNGTSKEQVQCMFATVPFKTMSPQIIIELVNRVDYCLNNGVTPRHLMTGVRLDAQCHCCFQSGNYVLGHEERGDNLMNPRAQDAIFFHPTDNQHGAMFLFDLATERRIRRQMATVAHMADMVVNRVHEIASKQNSPDGIAFGDAEGNATILDLDTELVATDEDSSDKSFDPDDDSIYINAEPQHEQDDAEIALNNNNHVNSEEEFPIVNPMVVDAYTDPDPGYPNDNTSEGKNVTGGSKHKHDSKHDFKHDSKHNSEHAADTQPNSGGAEDSHNSTVGNFKNQINNNSSDQFEADQPDNDAIGMTLQPFVTQGHNKFRTSKKVSKKMKPTLFTAWLRKKMGVVVSPCLLNHISNDAACYSYDRRSSGVVDFASCVFIRKSKKSSGGALPEVLDNQIMYDPSVKPIGRALIGWELTNIEDDDDTVSEDNFFFPNNDDEDEGSESTEAPHSLSVNDEEGNDIDVDDSHRDTNMAITAPSAGRHVSDELMVNIKLMKIMRNHSIPLVAEKELYEWAIKSEPLREISATVPERKGDGFEPHLIDWCSKKSMTSDVPVSLHSLLTNVTLVKEENLSFPHAEDPTLPVRFPELQGNIDIDKLYHGKWWINTWGKRCRRDSNEILVPIFLYMDGIAIDNSGQSTLTPLNMTLGIFNTLTQNCQLDAWETIYFHPTGSRDKGNKSIDNVNNLHSGLRCALSSLKEVCNLTDGIEWSNLPWNKKKWSIQMKFVVAYFIGDTPQHNQLCGHYQMANTKMIYRHCNCPRAHGNNSCVNVLKIPSINPFGYTKMSDFTSPTVEEGVNVEQYFKNVSHHRVHKGNVFYDLDFGENPHNIHLASPGERLHMHQLGCTKQAAETFREDFLGNNTPLLDEMDPKKEGNQYIGMLYIQMLALLSAEGRQLLLSPRTTTNLENRSRKCEEEIDGRVYALELLLGMEEFLKYAGTFDQVFKEDNKGVLNLNKMVVHFINCINNYLQRSKGEGNNLVKNHMYFHLSQYMRLFGPPIGWDSAASESNHKIMEYRTIDRLDREFDLFHHKSFTGVSHPTEGVRLARSKFSNTVRDGLPYMKWDKKKNASVPWFPSDVLKFCCDMVLPAAGTNMLCGSTEHKRYDNYQHLLDRGGLQVYPCQILCLLHLEGPFPPGSSVSGFELVHNGYYAVVCCFLSVDPISSKRAEGRRDRHALEKQGMLRNKLYLFDCNAIKSEVVVVRNFGSKDNFFVLGNRERRLFHFSETMAGLETKRMESIVKAGEMSNDL
eukprot:jgi/Psemu1/29635/gm1.29635_g